MTKKQKAIADIFDNLRRVYQVINEQSKKAKKQTGITGPQLWAIKMIAELEVLRNDVRDAFGPPPDAVETLLELAEIRVLAQPWGIRSLVLVEPDVVFAIDDLQTVQPLFATGPGSPRVPDPQTIHWRLPKRYLEPKTLLTTLRKQLRAPTPALAALKSGI